MKQTTPRINAEFAALLVGLLLFPAGSQAAQMAYEGFDYPTGTATLSGQNGGSGWGGVWQTVNNGSAELVTTSLAAGTSAPAGYDLRSLGNSCNLPNQRRIGRKLDTSASGPFGSRGYRDGAGRIGADGTTLYLSFMQQPNGTSNYYEFEFHRDDLGDGGRIGGIGNDQGGDNVNLRAPNGTHTVIGAGSTEVNFYVVRIDFKAGNDDVYVYMNPTSTTEPGVPTLTKLAAADMSFNGISFGAFNNGRTVAHDELRLGESWADVTVPPIAAPVITSQPRSSVTSYESSTIVLTAAASGQPLPTYQWFKGDTLMDGETHATLTLTNVNLSDAADYHLTATNSEDTATSGAAHVVVLATPPGLLVYEGFDYDAGAGNLPGKSGGLGWGAPWTNINAGGVNVQPGNLEAGTNAPNGFDAESLGNSAFTPTEQRDGRLLDTTIGGRIGAAGYVDESGNIGADGKTLYVSFLQQPNGTSYFYEFEFHRGQLGDPGRIGGIGNDTGNPIVNLRTGGFQTLIGPGSTGVNLYVVRIDFKPGNDDVYVYQNPLSATEPATATLTQLAASDMSFNGLSLAAWVNGRTVTHDEIRIGQSWSDVVFGTSRRELVWLGDAIDNNWDFASANWDAGAGGTAFVGGDPVTFDDTGSDSPALNIPATVATASLTATNSTKNYTLGGVGAIERSGGLLKSGSGSLTLNGTAAFGSAVVVDDGALALNGTIAAGGGLNVNAGSATLGGDNSFVGMVTTNGNVTITGPTTIGGSGAFVWIGNFPFADSSLTIEPGGSLNMISALADAWVIGRDGGSGAVIQNGGTVTYNPPNRDVAFIGASAGSSATTATYDINGGTLEMSNMRLALALGPITTHLTQTGGTINTRQLDLGANTTTGTGTYTLTGGVMTIGAGGITSNSGLYEINLAGGTIAAAADWNSSMAMDLTASGEAMTFDTADHTISLGGGLGGTGGLHKTGTGTLVLTGFNSYSGPTTVSEGALGGTGNLETSTITVAADAAIAPGIGGIGVFYSGAVTFESGSTLVLEIDSTFDNADELSAYGNVDIRGAHVSFSEVGVGIIPAGSPPLIILDYSGAILTGTFVGYPEGSSVTVGANTFTLSYADFSCVTLTSTTVDPYDDWATGKGLDGSSGKDPAFDADPDLDGIDNGLEWILGGNPLAAEAEPLVRVAGSAQDGLTLTFTREETSLGIATLAVEWSDTLEDPWSEVTVEQSSVVDPNGVSVLVDEGPAPDAVTVHIPATLAPGGSLFARLRAILP